MLKCFQATGANTTFKTASVTNPSLAQLSNVGGNYVATILKTYPNGNSDVRYDIGGKENAVPRARVSPLEDGEWKTVYMGQDLGYAMEANIPDYILEKEGGIVIAVDFVLQTLGSEDPLDEPSLHSLQVTFSTVNHSLVLSQFLELNKIHGGSSIAGEVSLTESKKKKKIKEAILIDGHVIESWHNGELVEGTGYGKHFV